MSTIAYFVPGERDLSKGPSVPNAVLGMLIFVACEVMFFLALFSAYFVSRSKVGSIWAPPGDLRLPVLATGFNTLVLLASGALMVAASRCYQNPTRRSQAYPLFSQALLLGAFFVCFQGYEWMNLLRFGMTIGSGLFAATFYLIIGSHAFHATGAILAMGWLLPKVKKQSVTVDGLKAMTIFWLFVVGIWPILYGLVYFG
jgi:heme/copper-type cytochrome/quinol oxidase subunit 3